MTYNDQMAELARALARIIAVPLQAPPATELAVIVAYRTDVLDALDGVHRRLLPAGRGWRQLDRARDVEREPVSALGVLLAQHPRGAPSQLSPTDRAQLEPRSTAGQQWKAAAAHALLAGADAAALHPRWDADPATAWRAVADIADVAEAFAVADNDLAAACAGDDELTAVLPPNAAHTGLRVAAGECARLARTGPLAHIEDADTNPPPSAHPMVVHGPADLEQAQHRLAIILGRTDPPAPDLIAHIATGQARAHLSTARVLHAAADHDTDHAADYREAAAALRARVDGLVDIADSCQAVESLRGHRDLRAVHQTGEIMRALRRVEDGLTAQLAAQAAPQLLTWARRGTDVIYALDQAVRRGVRTGQYLLPNPLERREHGQTAWVPAHLLHDPPPLLDATNRTASREQGIAAAIQHATARLHGPAPAAHPSAAAATDQLRRVLTERPPTRPPRPGDPVPGRGPTPAATTRPR